MNDDLSTYLRDHIAGAEAAIGVVCILRKAAQEPVLTQLLDWLLIRVEEDKAILETLAASFETRSSGLKDSAAWLGARAISMKIKAGRSPFGAFEGLEFLSLGIQGKLHLWKALQRSPACTSSSYRPDYLLLIQRAEAQHSRVEQLRLVLAGITL